MRTTGTLRPGDTAALTRDGLGRLVDALRADGRTVIGPVVRDGAVLHAPITSLADLPAGWGDVQEGGSYRLARRDDEALFGHTVGPQSWKPFFLAPRVRLFRVDRTAEGLTFDAEASEPSPRLALLGVRACDLQAIAVQDRVLGDGAFADADYVARRRDVFVVAVNCGQAGNTCFCVSMGTGPRATRGFDLALTEIAGERHRFVVEVGSERGAELLGRLDAEPAAADDVTAAAAIVARTADGMGRRLETDGVHALLTGNPEHPRWDDVAARCLACANCTLVCPTCFCTTVEDVSDLTGDHAERWRRWDSCFTLDFSGLHGGSVRATTRARYRQWLTHKLATWMDQFGTSGCVGCGRCITWCPVGIDLTAEVAAIRTGAGVTPGRGGDGDA
jgi:ferredoxin